MLRVCVRHARLHAPPLVRESGIRASLKGLRDNPSLASVLPSRESRPRFAAAVRQPVMAGRWRKQMKMIERNEASPEGFIRRLLPLYGVATALFCVVLAATTAMAQQSAGTVTET